MKKLLVASLILTASAFAFQPALSAVQSVTNGVISVSSSATKEVEPDIAEISFSVETTNKNVELATKDNKYIVDKVINALKTKIQTGDELKTSSYSVRPDYSYSSKDSKRTLIGYTVTNSVKVTTKKVSNVGTLIDTAVSNGANRVDNLSFKLENEKTYCNDLYPQIVKDAQSQASIIARALNMNVVGLKALNASCSTQYSSAPYRLMYAKTANAEADQVRTPVEAGKIKVFSSVNAEFNVK